MEASSPLAALQRPLPVPNWDSRDGFRPHAHAHFAAAMTSGNSFSLREQLHKHTTDYFTTKDVRGSSPAASLAADLSQNFRIDTEVSPEFPTPRRALFTSSALGGMVNREYATTPPLPSSSPAPMTELMEISPLPHKIPFSTQIEVTSPTPISTPEGDDMMLDSPAPIGRQPSLEVPKPLMSERKFAAPRRPSLSRMKGFTTTSVPNRAHPENCLPPFRFGSDPNVPRISSNLSPGECFETASPPQERRPQSANSPCAPMPLNLRSRPQFSSMGGAGGSRYGSPASGHARRQSNPFLRNRKQIRRSLSMFEHPGDVMKTKAEGGDSAPSGLQAVADIEEAHELALPYILPDDPTDTIPRVTRETLLDVMDGKYADHFDHKMVIDCRFEYEYDGGHIDGAVNYNNKEFLASQLFATPMTGRSLLIFHCEYSAHRAPLMARHIRSQDRTVNAEHYPKLTYPEVYILEGGYSGFFAEHRHRCYPQEYVEMSDTKHQRTCEREMGRLKARKGLGRSQTFAFGQREPCVGESPTAPTRPTSRHDHIAMVGNSPVLGERSQTRRMASY